MTTILVVDDNLMNMELVADVLELDGFDVITADGGEKAVEMVRSESPDLILMDLRMPGMSGAEALRILRADGVMQDIPIVALTASVMKGSRDRILKEGFDGYLEKPIDPITFPETVRTFLKK